VRISRIRLLESQVRYAMYRCTMRGGGSGNRLSNRVIFAQLQYAFCEQRESHLRQASTTSCQNLASASKFDVTP
jgi:aspartyl/asparaginyl beta-hydroxylase (cupin superfamily)